MRSPKPPGLCGHGSLGSSSGKHDSLDTKDSEKANLGRRTLSVSRALGHRAVRSVYADGGSVIQLSNLVHGHDPLFLQGEGSGDDDDGWGGDGRSPPPQSVAALLKQRQWVVSSEHRPMVATVPWAHGGTTRTILASDAGVATSRPRQAPVPRNTFRPVDAAPRAPYHTPGQSSSAWLYM